MDYTFILDLGIIILCAKAFGLLAKRLGAPQVVGEIVAGNEGGTADGCRPQHLHALQFFAIGKSVVAYLNHFGRQNNASKHLAI